MLVHRLMQATAAILTLPAAEAAVAERQAPSQSAAVLQAHAAAVRIVRDDVGIAHIHGRSDADAVFGMIYAQAEDDFPRIERNYLVALGRLAEVEGPSAVWQDLRQRLFIDHDQLKADYASSPAWLRSLLDAWAGGLNHYLATHPEERPKLITRFEPWMALAFSEGSIGGDVERGVALEPLRAFYAGAGAAPIITARAEAGRLVEPKGSNGIAIGPGRSASGHPLLWINPHTSFFFRSEQQVSSDEGLNVYGAATWGQFFIYQGFNGKLGWMHTSSGVDNIDEFAVEVARRGDGFEWRDGATWRPFTYRTVSLKVRDDDGRVKTRSFQVPSTKHGPIIRADDDRWIAIAMLNSPRAALEQSWLRTKAQSLDEYLAVARRRANSSNNTILAAADGTIAYLHPQFVPVRDNRFDYSRTVDGSDPATAWRGLHTLESLPQVIRPASGWVVNTNNAPWSAAGGDSPKAADFPRYMDMLGENPRGIHATMLLSAAEPLSPEGLRALAYDSFLPLFDEQIPLLKRGFDALATDDPLRAELVEPLALLDGWDRRWSLGSEATSLAIYWGEALWAREGPKAFEANMPLFGWLAERTADADRLAALGDALAKMSADHGGWRVPWGRINRFQRLDGAIEQRFDDHGPSVPVPFTSGNFGSLAAFGVERQAGQRCFYGTSGNSFVAMVEFGPVLRAWSHSAGGQSGDPASVHFDDQATDHAAGRLRPIPLDDAALARYAPGAYRPGEKRPAGPRRAAAPFDSRCGED